MICGLGPPPAWSRASSLEKRGVRFKLGAPVDMIAALGTDLFTERLLSGLKAAGVDTHAIQTLDGHLRQRLKERH